MQTGLRSSAALWVAALTLASTLPAAAWEPPALVLVIAVDQLRPDRLSAALPGGLGRLAREGRVYPEAALGHAVTETCPGHASIVAGRHPAALGIPGNRFFDPESREVLYCVADPAPDAAVIGAPSDAPYGRSPRTLRTRTLGDWLKRVRSRSRVFTVSGKDRAAIVMGGHDADAAYWFQGGGTPGFTTSRYYREALPAWVQRFNGSASAGEGILARLPRHWEHGAAGAPAGRPDDFAGEAERFNRTSAHPLRDDDPARAAEQLERTPYLDDLTLAFATRLVEEEALGSGDAPDLLALGLSATDLIGHFYGPYSHESADALARLDRSLGRFLAGLEARLGRERILAVLTADHGVLPLPEWLEARGASTCPLEGGRSDVRSVGLGLLWQLYWKHSAMRWPRSWLRFAGSQLAVDPALARKRGVAPATVIADVERRLESHPALAELWTPAEIASGESELAGLYRHSFVPGRSGDALVQLAHGCLFSSYSTGTNHGTPYLYDRAVPLVFWGDAIAPASVPGAAATVDIAPTLAHRMGIVPPPDLDGRALFR